MSLRSERLCLHLLDRKANTAGRREAICGAGAVKPSASANMFDRRKGRDGKGEGIFALSGWVLGRRI